MGNGESELFRFAEKQHGVISLRQVQKAGMSTTTFRRRVDSGVVERVGPAVYRVVGAPRTFEARVMAAVFSAGDLAAASHRTAAYVHGLMDRPSDIEVVTNRTGRRSRPFVLHQSTDLMPHHITTVGGVIVTSGERTAIDIGVPHGLGATAKCLDEGRRRGVVDLHEAAALLHEVARKGRNGVGPARTIISERLRWNEITDSELEDRFLRLVQRAGMPRPIAQHRIYDERGSIVARLDFAYPDRWVAIELDSIAFHTDQQTFRTDRRRQNHLVLAGWTILRFTWWDVLAGQGWVLDTLTAALSPNWDAQDRIRS